MLERRGLLLLLACTAYFWTATEAALDTESTIGQSSSSCYRPELSQYRELFKEAFDVKLNGTATIYINCMSFNKNRDLKSAIVSGNTANGNTSVIEFTCKGRTLLAFVSEREFNTTDNQSCVDCATDSTTGDACLKPCACEDERERCYGDVNTCDCSRVLVYDIGPVTNAVRDLGEEDGEIEKRIEETIEGLSKCEDECRDTFSSNSHGNQHICYACGIQFCSACHEEENGHGECTQCLPHTTLYHEEGECLFGLRAEILEVAEEQEKEVEEEEKEKEVARLQLAIILPIVCVLVIAFFIFMSFIAHKRYPHIGEKGVKRHRTKRELTDEDLPTHDSVFKPQPTVRLR